MNVGAGVVYAILGTMLGVPLAVKALTWRSDEISVHWTGSWFHAAADAESVVAGVASGVLAGLVAGRLGASLEVPPFGLTAVLAIPLAVVDVVHHRLPYALVVPIYAGCIACFVLASAVSGNFGGLVRALLAGMLVGGVGLALALAAPGQLGLGDVALAGALALQLGWLGWRHVELGLLAGLVLAATVGPLRVALRRVPLRQRFALGPALLAGWVTAVVFG